MSIRLRHPTLQDVNFTVVHHRQYRRPLFCAVCAEVHTFKTYHLKLDSQGEVVVSKDIWGRLAELDGLPLRRVGNVRKPEPQILVAPPAGVSPELQAVRTESFVPKKLREMVANGEPVQ